MTTITLPGDLEAWAREEVSAGRARSVEEFVAEALRERRAMIMGHQGQVEEAYRCLASGELIDEADMDAAMDRWLEEDSAEQ